tara:strand:+ start:38252 stop:38905 length:654 start_codon:yes stop_codon:yes gene_type:complete
MQVILAMSAFVLSHVLISRTALRPWLVARLGRRVYLGAYSLLSVVLLGWVILALLDAERTALWATPYWAYPFAAACSLLAVVLITVGALSPNPYSVAFRSRGFNPQRPGIIGWTRHPLIWGLTLWGVAHIPANGEWPALLLFGGSALFGLVGIGFLERRASQDLTPADAVHGSRLAAGHLDRSALLGLILGCVLWMTLLFVHPRLFGADPLALLNAM